MTGVLVVLLLACVVVWVAEARAEDGRRSIDERSWGVTHFRAEWEGRARQVKG